MIHTLFTTEDADRAYDEWGANCGPGAIAAICGLTLDELRPQMGDFEAKGYTNPMLMWKVLRRLRVRWHRVSTGAWPHYGLARVQWEGVWTEPGVPIAARYKHTHWVGASTVDPMNTTIFDINAMANGSGWCDLGYWTNELVPLILENGVPGATGRWHLTHVVEVAPAPLGAVRPSMPGAEQ